MDLIRRFPSDVLARGLDSWQWLDGIADMSPLVTSPFGDVFLEGRDGVWFLDLIEGRLTREWDSSAELQESLNTAAGQDRFLLAGLAEAASRSGLEPGSAQVLSFTIPPVLGGKVESDNVEVMDVVVVLSLAGQLHQQIKDLPPGTPITGFTLEGE